MTKPLNIVFAGTPLFGLSCLNALLASHHKITAIYTQPDRPAGRGRQLQQSDVKKWALSHQIPIYQPVNFKSDETIDELRLLAPDVIVVIAYGLILPKVVLDIPRLGAVNVHASLLPSLRGASPIQHAILHGDKQSGVTIMQMDVGMDTGDMLSKAHCNIEPEYTAQELHDVLSHLAVHPLLETLDALAKNYAPREPQDHTKATYAPKIKKEDARINWKSEAKLIHQLIRAFNPVPTAYTHANDLLVKIHQAKVIIQDHTHVPGAIVSIDKKGVLVATGSGLILIERLQFPGGKILSVSDWLNSKQSHLYQGLILQ